VNSFNIVHVIVFIVLVIIGLLLIRQSVALHKEKRISRYTIDSIQENNDSIFDEVYLSYLRFVKKISKIFSKSKFICKLSKRYEKYVLVGDEVSVINFIVHKVVIGLVFVIVVLFSYAFQMKKIGFLTVLIFFLVGYYLYDIYLIYNSRVRIMKIKREMLRAVMIMNNAFKSGKSTMQAVYIASKKLPYPINYEFKKIYQDMKYGLAVDVVFDRFAKRVNIEEATYLASSLTILNRTGGNIVSVFNAIEKTLFDKKKMQEELKNLTGVSNLVVKILLFVPFVFIILIYMLNPTYFDPLFESLLGYMIIGVIAVMFIIYVWILQKVLKVRF